MDEMKQFIKRSLAIDSASALSKNTGDGFGLNPQIWDTKVREFQEANQVLVGLCGFFDMRGIGSSLTVTIDATPTAASLTADTADASVSAFAPRQITFTVAEYTKRYQSTKLEMETTFFSSMDRASRQIAYSMVAARETLAYTTARDGCGNSYICNGKSNVTDLSSTDTMNYGAITNAIALNESDLYVDNKYLVINHTQKQQLLALGTINKANEFGTRDAIQKGLIGELFGLMVYATQFVTTSSNVAKALVIGVSASGESALGYALKRDTTIETQYFAASRMWDIVGSSAFGFKVLHPGAICSIATYA